MEEAALHLHTWKPQRLQNGRVILQVLLASNHGRSVQARKPRGVELWFNIALMVVYGVAGVLAAIGSIHNIILHANEYRALG